MSAAGKGSAVGPIIALVALSFAGGALKIYGSLVGGSKSVFVDAMTSVANTLAILLILRFFRVSAEPPDVDHHYGHHRVALGGPISTLMLYSFVAGVVLLDVVGSLGAEYRVSYESPLYAALAAVPYGAAVLLARRSHPLLYGYGAFTAAELMESAVSVACSLGGAAVSYLVDLAGAVALAGYIVFELVKSFREVVEVVSDAAPSEVVSRIRRTVEKHGVGVGRIRVRRVVESVYQGDVVVEVSPGTPVEQAHRIADSIERELRGQGMDVVVHVEPSRRRVERPGRAGP